jgi:hypothetical protein
MAGKPNGRPREWDREKLIWQLMQWAELPNSLNLNAFCTLPEIMISPRKLLSFVSADEDFREQYEIVKAKIAVRREEAVCEKILTDCAYNRTIRYMDGFENNYWRKEKEFESSLKQKENQSQSGDIYVTVSPKLTSGANVRTEGLPNTFNTGAE